MAVWLYGLGKHTSTVCMYISRYQNKVSEKTFRVIGAGYWPGSPKDCSYFFAQDLFSQWDFLQKRLPGTSEVAFLKALGDFSKSKGRVNAFY